MSHFADVPDVIVKPGAMLGQWGGRAKVAAFLLAVVVYGYLLLLIKTVYLKDQRLDRIAAIAVDTEEMVRNLQAMDQTLAADLDALQTY